MARTIFTDPFQEFDRFTSNLLRGTLSRPVSSSLGVWKDKDKFVVEFDLPGVNPEDVNLEIDKDAITVSGERTARVDKDADVLAEERSHGVFRRQVALGNDLDAENATATYSHGVLTVTVPVSGASPARRIAISTGDDDSAIGQDESPEITEEKTTEVKDS